MADRVANVLESKMQSWLRNFRESRTRTARRGSDFILMNFTFSHAFIVLPLLLISASTLAEDTAYSALRAVGAKHGEESLSRVIEIRGHGGAWRVILADAQARAGVREIKVHDGRITGESKPSKKRNAVTPMDLSLLNLDSDGVFATVNQDREETVPPALVDYTLTNATDENKPVWTVKIHDQARGKGTSMRIAADTGIVIPNPVAPVPGDAQVAVEDESASNPVKTKKAPARSRESRGSPDVVGNVVRRIENVGSQLKHFLPWP